MPPPMPNPQKRMTANPARPVARYRPGKAVQQEEESSDEEEEDVPEPQTKQKPPPHAPQVARPKASVTQVRHEDDDEEGFVTDEEDEVTPSTAAIAGTQQSDAAPAPTTQPSARIPQAQTTSRDESEEDEDGEDEEDESSEEEESSSEEEAPQRKFQRPTFIKKSDRKPVNSKNATSSSAIAQPELSDSQAASQADISSTPEVDEQLRRRAQADLYIQDHLERDALARAAGKKHWDDDDELTPEQMIDDTDGLDPESEYQAWKLRELRRLKRDREAIEAREKEIEELERRRNLTQEERDREDAAFVAKQKEDREENRGKATYLARYHHKGAFFQDDEMAEILKKRDIMGAKFADEVSDKSVLPEYMRVRDMTKLGKKGRTRYTDLKGQDTGRFGEDVKRWRGAGDDRNRYGDSRSGGLTGVDERFMPDRDSGHKRDDKRSYGFDKRRRSRSQSRSRSPRRRRDDSRSRDDSYRPTRRRRSYSSRSRSPSRTPPRRKRSPSPYNERDKRRRVET